MNIFTIDMAGKSEILNSNSILRLYKQKLMLKFMEIKSNEPKLTQKQISMQLGFSDSTIKRYKDDINMHSPYNRNKYEKKNTKSNISSINSTSQTKTATENTNNNNKKCRNNVLKPGSFIENQDNGTNYITIARKL